MSYSPPKKVTVILSFIILALGIILGLTFIFEPDVIYDLFSDIPIEDFTKTFMTICFSLTLIGWLLLYLGVRMRGV